MTEAKKPKKARQIDAHNAAITAYDEWIAANPPQITWAPNGHGVMVATQVIEPNGNSGKTHCKQLHAYDEDNTIIKADGSRECRQCKRRHNRETSARKRREARERAA